MKIGMRKIHGKVYSIVLGMIIVIGSTVFFNELAYANVTKTDALIVDVEVTGDDNGQVKTGSEIEIIYKLSNLKNIYAASIDWTYDNSLIKVNSIEPGAEISGNIYEAYRDTAKDGNRARYAFTFLGSDEKGMSGKADFVKIKATAIKDGQVDVKKNTVKFQMVKKVNNSMEEVKEIYVNSQGETVKVEGEKENPSTSEEKTTGNTNSESASNSSSSVGEKITVLGTNNSTKAVSLDEDDNNEISEDNLENKDIKDEVNDNNENVTNENDDNTSKNVSDDLDENNNETKVYKNSNIIGIISIISLITAITIGGLYIIKIKKV